MLKIKYLASSAVLLASSLISIQANADNYWGIGLGNSSFDIKPLYGIFEVDDGTVFKFVLGGRSDNTGYEMGLSFASYDWTGTSLATHNVFNLTLAGIGFLPVTDSLDVFGKIGVNLWSTTVDFVGDTY